MPLVVHPASPLIPGTAAIPGRRLGRCLLRRPQTDGGRCLFQSPVASSTARRTSSHVSNRRPFSARLLSTFHHGSIRFRYAAYLGWKTNSHRGCHSAKKSTSVVRCVGRLSRIAYTCVTSAGTQASTRSRKSTQLAPFRFS